MAEHGIGIVLALVLAGWILSILLEEKIFKSQRQKKEIERLRATNQELAKDLQKLSKKMGSLGLSMNQAKISVEEFVDKASPLLIEEGGNDNES